MIFWIKCVFLSLCAPQVSLNMHVPNLTSHRVYFHLWKRESRLESIFLSLPVWHGNFWHVTSTFGLYLIFVNYSPPWQPLMKSWGCHLTLFFRKLCCFHLSFLLAGKSSKKIYKSQHQSVYFFALVWPKVMTLRRSHYGKILCS